MAEQQGFLWGDSDTARIVTVCAYGETGEGWTGQHHCHRCEAEVDAACEWMRQAILRGEYDEQGYTPLERKAQAKRQREREREREGVTPA